MKEVGKINKIYKGFFGDVLPDEIAESRRKICSTCEFNSVNAEKLSLTDSIRNSFTSPFCTLCKCQIHEKTGSALEECAMYMIGEEKKWFKIKIETMEKQDLNLTHIGGIAADIQLENDTFVVDYGKVTPLNDTSIELLFESEEALTLIKMEVTCGCTSESTTQISDKAIQTKLKVDISKVGLGAGYKTVYLNYSQDSVKKRQAIKFKFFRVA